MLKQLFVERLIGDLTDPAVCGDFKVTWQHFSSSQSLICNFSFLIPFPFNSAMNAIQMGNQNSYIGTIYVTSHMPVIDAC